MLSVWKLKIILNFTKYGTYVHRIIMKQLAPSCSGFIGVHTWPSYPFIILQDLSCPIYVSFCLLSKYHYGQMSLLQDFFLLYCMLDIQEQWRVLCNLLHICYTMYTGLYSNYPCALVEWHVYALGHNHDSDIKNWQLSLLYLTHRLIIKYYAFILFYVVYS